MVIDPEGQDAWLRWLLTLGAPLMGGLIVALLMWSVHQHAEQDVLLQGANQVNALQDQRLLEHTRRIERLEGRQDDVLRRLDVLEERVRR